MTFGRKLSLRLMAGGILFASSAAHAETLTVSGVLPAATEAGIGVETIVVEDISGNHGAKLKFELKEALDGAGLNGEQWFEVIPPMTVMADAVIQGSASTQSSITEMEPKAVESCAKKNEDNECVRYKTTYYDCSRFSVSFYPDIQIVGLDGEVVYSARDELTNSVEHCSDQSSRPSLTEMSDDLVSSFAREVRRAMLPRMHSADYRVLESRKGLEKAERRAFKDALKLTKTDQDAACNIFINLEDASPEQTSVIFNVGLCYERAGQYARAQRYYDLVQELENGKYEAEAGLVRLDKWQRGKGQLAEREAIFAERYANAEVSEEDLIQQREMEAAASASE